MIVNAELHMTLKTVCKCQCWWKMMILKASEMSLSLLLLIALCVNRDVPIWIVEAGAPQTFFSQSWQISNLEIFIGLTLCLVWLNRQCKVCPHHHLYQTGFDVRWHFCETVTHYQLRRKRSLVKSWPSRVETKVGVYCPRSSFPGNV